MMRLTLTPFDRLVWLILAALLLLTAVVIVRGDTVGVQVAVVSPAAGATGVSSQAPIRVTFDQPIELVGALRPLVIEPLVSGTAQWEGETLIFYPAEPLQPDTSYTVTIPAGLRGQGGQIVQHAFQWQFRTGHPRVIYLDEDDRGHYQLRLVDPSNLDRAPVQLTSEPFGVWDYAPSPDGTVIAYTALREDGGSDLQAITPDGNQRRTLLACPGAECSGPAWAPDSQRLVYERRAASVQGAGQGLSRLWWLDLASGGTVPVFDDSQWLGFGAAISPDGQWLSHVAPHKLALQVYNLNDGRSLEIPNEIGEAAVWSPQGNLLLYAGIVAQGSEYQTHVFRTNVESGSTVDISGEDALSDSEPAWSPNGDEVVLSRRMPDSPVTGRVWVMPAAGGEGRFLPGNSAYYQSELSWSPDGRTLLSQRTGPTGVVAPQIWLQDVHTGAERVLVDAGSWPRWLP